MEVSTPHIMTSTRLKLFWIMWPWDTGSVISCGEGAVPGENELLRYTVDTGQWPHGPVHAVSMSTSETQGIVEFNQFEG